MNATDKTYNGWTNYETWNVALWIGNDEGSYQYWEKEQAEECYRDAVADDANADREEWTSCAVRELSDRLQSELAVENQPDLGSSMYADLLSAALSEVNWYEIATNYIESIDRDEIEKDVLPEPDTSEDDE